MKKINLAVLPGDGIGKEVTEATLPIFEKLGIPVNITIGDIGWEFWKKEGNAVPERTWKLIDNSDAILLGAITSKPQEQALKELNPELRNKGLTYVSPVIQLRQRLGLFANVRPVFSIPNNPRQISENINMTIIRENTEGLYSGFDFHPIPKELIDFMNKNKRPHSFWNLEDPEDGSLAFRLMTKEGTERIIRFAFNWALKNNYELVTWVDKPNVMRKSGQFAINVLEQVASEFPTIKYEVQNVDAVAMWMVKDPSRFGVIVSENQFGDILSDLGAGLMGGLGFAPSANLGEKKSYFEPVHGSAPKHYGKNIVNPCAMFITISLLLKQYGYIEQAKLIDNAVRSVIEDGKVLTYDLSGNASTVDMAKEIISRC